MPTTQKDKSNIANMFEEMVNIIGLIRDPIEFSLPIEFRESNLKSEQKNFTKLMTPPYIPIKRNIYVTKRRIEDDGIFCSCAPPDGAPIACDGDCQCGMLFSCCSTNCKCEGKCANSPFQSRPVKKLNVVKTEKCGFGLVAEEDIKQGEFVIEYVGEVIDDKTCEQRLWKMKHRGDTNFYLCEVNSNMVIDATNKGNRSRFINHSCEPNTEMQKWRVDGETRVGIFALRDIKKGEDVTYDYMFVQFGADQDCHCGTLKCKLKLGNKPNTFGGGVKVMVESKRKTKFENCIGETLRVWRRRDNMYVAGFIYDFDVSTSVHTIMFVDGVIERMDLKEEEWDFLPK